MHSDNQYFICFKINKHNIMDNGGGMDLNSTIVTHVYPAGPYLIF